MGSGSFNTKSYSRSYASNAMQKSSVREVFQKSSVDSRFDPKNIVVRESCDSDDHPASTPIIIALDGTGSMGQIPHNLLTSGGLGRLMDHIYTKNTVTDPQIMTMVVGDVRCDNAALQATQFESDIRIAEQLKDLYLEGGGGGNGTESYDLPWLFAATKTKTDAFDKRGKKGYLFTIGDEGVPVGIEAHQYKDVFGSSDFTHLTASKMLELAQEKWNCFHILCEETSYAASSIKRLRREWDSLMGRHVLYLSNHKFLSELVIAVIEIEEGRSMEDVLSGCENNEIRSVLQHAFE